MILSTYPEEPRALPVGDPLDDIEGKPPMGPVEQGAAWLDKELPLLPRKGWQDDEKAFIQERAGTPQSKKTDFPRAGH